jgi:hypothetical protein
MIPVINVKVWMELETGKYGVPEGEKGLRFNKDKAFRDQVLEVPYAVIEPWFPASITEEGISEELEKIFAPLYLSLSRITLLVLKGGSIRQEASRENDGNVPAEDFEKFKQEFNHAIEDIQRYVFDGLGPDGKIKRAGGNAYFTTKRDCEGWAWLAAVQLFIREGTKARASVPRLIRATTVHAEEMKKNGNSDEYIRRFPGLYRKAAKGIDLCGQEATVADAIRRVGADIRRESESARSHIRDHEEAGSEWLLEEREKSKSKRKK